MTVFVLFFFSHNLITETFFSCRCDKIQHLQFRRYEALRLIKCLFQANGSYILPTSKFIIFTVSMLTS